MYVYIHIHTYLIYTNANYALSRTGSTDLHLAYVTLDGRAVGDCTSLSTVHKLATDSPSIASHFFTSFFYSPANATLKSAAANGRCAIVFAGAAVFAFGGKRVAARGNYFRRLPLAELRAADEDKAHFERFVGLSWNENVSGGEEGVKNPVFVGALGPSKPRLDAVM